MATVLGHNTILPESLIFHYDQADINSYPGEPTVNILYAGNPTLNNGIVWNNSGDQAYSNSDTDVEKPHIPGVDTSNLLMMSSRVLVGGSLHIGCASFSGAASTTYTISVWFRQTRAGSNQPYFRTNVNNNSLGNFNYNGDTNAANWPENKWIRISCTATLQSNETGGYLSNYLGETNDKIWYFAPQVEQKDHMTAFALGTRGATDSLKDLISNRTITVPGDLVYDGTNFNDHPYITSGDWQARGDGEDWTMEHIVYYNVVPAGYNNTTSPACFFGSDSISENNWYWSVLSNKLALWNISPGYWRYGSTTLQPNRYYHVAIKCFNNGYKYRFYLNGVAEGGDHVDQVWNRSYSGLRVKTIGAGDSGNRRTLNGIQPVTRIYNRALNDGEIYQSYLSYKERFNL